MSFLFRALLGFAIALPCCAQEFPSRPVHLINAYTPGGPTDLVARAVAQKLQEKWGQPVLVESRPGAAGAIGIQFVAASPPDGHTLIIMPIGNAAIIPFMNPQIGYDVDREFVPVTIMANIDNILVVGPTVPASNVSELLALARSSPGKLTYSSPGQGSLAHVGVELLKVIGHVDMLHVPYKGVAPALNDVLGGQITMILGQASSVLPHVKAGKVKALGIASLKRSTSAPEIPTIAEQGMPGFEVVAWYALMAPAGTPRDVVAKIAAETGRALRAADVRERFAALGVDPMGNTPEEFAAVLKKDRARWGELVKTQKLRFD
jgi:tripartite-type tricarboxylate transporter receptor subunit TctC